MFGVVMERDQPGVVLDALGVQGARIRFLDKQNDEHWAEQLTARKPNLVIYQFGANESGDGYAYPMDEYNETMTAVLEQGRRAVPEASCLVLSAMDRASKKGELLRSMRIIPMIVKEQRAAALATGCAFFNIFEAMKESGGMPGWVRRGLGQADLTHPTGVGSEILARWIYRALMKDYNAFLKAPEKQPPP
jgi:lysophospholipase L1-like esterase